MSPGRVCSLRLYTRRGGLRGFPWWKSFFRRPPLALVQAALKEGVLHASVSWGHMGFSQGAREVALDLPELPADGLPVCIELVGERPILERFMEAHADELAGATALLIEGVLLSHLASGHPVTATRNPLTEHGDG
jgi:PII-like signaling protein